MTQVTIKLVGKPRSGKSAIAKWLKTALQDAPLGLKDNLVVTIEEYQSETPPCDNVTVVPVKQSNN